MYFNETFNKTCFDVSVYYDYEERKFFYVSQKTTYFCMNANIMNTQIFQLIRYDFKNYKRSLLRLKTHFC